MDKIQNFKFTRKVASVLTIAGLFGGILHLIEVIARAVGRVW